VFVHYTGRALGDDAPGAASVAAAPATR
jgi:hypothetical protein